MLGAIIGDIAGSRYVRDKIFTKAFPFFSLWDSITDAGILTLAVGKALLEARPDRSDLGSQAVFWMQQLGRKFPDCGYGDHFRCWLDSENPGPYGSFGNGAAMRVSPCGWVGRSLGEVKALSRAVTEVSHNHPEGLKGAEAVAVSIYLARTGSTKEEIREFISTKYYSLDFTLEEIRASRQMDFSCQGSVPQAICAFLESDSFEDAVRNAISIGGGSAAASMAGAIGEAFYGIPRQMEREALTYFEDDSLFTILHDFQEKYPSKYL